MTDHNLAHLKIKQNTRSWPVREVTFIKLRKIDHDELEKDISTSALITDPASTVETLADQYQETLQLLLAKHAPLTTKTIRVRPTVPSFKNKSEKSDYFHAKILDCAQESRALFRLMDGLIGRGHGPTLPAMDTVKDTVDSFSDLFSSKIQKIRDELDIILLLAQ